MNDETIYKLVTMLGDARTAETELRRENAILQDRFYAFSKANDELMRRIADMEKKIAELREIEADWSAIKDELAEAVLCISQLEKQIAEYAPWEPIPDNVQRIACGSFNGSVYLSTDDDGRLVKVESQGNSIVMNLGDMRICCRRGMWAPF